MDEKFVRSRNEPYQKFQEEREKGRRSVVHTRLTSRFRPLYPKAQPRSLRHSQEDSCSDLLPLLVVVQHGLFRLCRTSCSGLQRDQSCQFPASPALRSALNPTQTTLTTVLRLLGLLLPGTDSDSMLMDNAPGGSEAYRPHNPPSTMGATIECAEQSSRSVSWSVSQHQKRNDLFASGDLTDLYPHFHSSV